MTETKEEIQIKKPTNYFKSFDGIRGVSCFLILLVHFRFYSFNAPIFFGKLCLHSFFIMSSFLITKNLILDKEKIKNFKTIFAIFYIKRTARIFPLYFFYVGLVLLLFVILKFGFHNSFSIGNEIKRYGLLVFTFTYNFKEWIVLHNGYTDYMQNIIFAHLWSLSLEEQFYIVIIFVAWFLNKKALQVLSITVICIIPIIRVIGYLFIGTKTNDDFLRTLLMWHSPMFQFDAFFYGVALAVFDIKKSKKILLLFITTIIILLVFTIVNAQLCSVADNITFNTAFREDKYFYRNYGIFFLDSLINLLCLFWFLSVIYFPEKLSFFTNNYLVKLGEISYGIYIFQFIFLPIGLITQYFLKNKIHLPNIICDVIGFFVFVYLNYLLSSLIYKKLQLPALRYRDVILNKYFIKDKT